MLYNRPHWPHRLRHGSAAACLRGLQVRIPPLAWMSVCVNVCVVRERSPRQADHSSRGILLSAVCPMCVIVKPR